ncbi:MAG: hypothetical protein JSV67_01820 [Thermoplasmatales archaeon]|jgi:hypothetical protein|nr:MAG: hypothetical protein JSV67_01820 [Thermoplasmatales archaeon]
MIIIVIQFSYQYRQTQGFVKTITTLKPYSGTTSPNTYVIVPKPKKHCAIY